jgi:hypothetical protein
MLEGACSVLPVYYNCNWEVSERIEVTLCKTNYLPIITFGSGT